MKQKRILFFACVMACWSIAYAQADTVINRYKEYLLRTVNPGDLGKLTASYNPVQQWKDLNYQDTQPAGWQVLEHLHRLRDMAMIWSDNHSAHYHDAALWRMINTALDHWLQKRYTNNNWWHNQIGVPRYMRDIIILLRDTLTGAQISQALEVLHQHRVQKAGAGANLVWSADLGLHYGILTHNDTLIRQCRNLLVAEVNITEGDGMQPDHSFHQHGARLQMYQYGSAFLKENVRIAWQLRNTPWAYPKEKTRILIDFVLQGWQWMARGMHTVPGTIDRSVSRVDALHSADLRDMLPYMSELSPANAPALAAMIREQENMDRPLEGFRYFPCSDLAAFHNKYFSFFIKTISNRTLSAESINRENSKGHLMNSGDGYTIRNGNEYFNMMPVWDWERLPGITTFRGADSIMRRPFCGSVSDGKIGLTAMDYVMKGKSGQKLAAKKFWACYENTVVCLVSGLQAAHIEGNAFTVLDQCRQQGGVNISTQTKTWQKANDTLSNVRWIYHNGIGYLPLLPARVALKLDTAAGSWSSINASGSADKVIEKVFMPVMMHEKKDSTGYAITYCKNARQLNAISRRPAWKVLQNNTHCQAIGFGKDDFMIAFYEAGSLSLPGYGLLGVNKPCLVLISGNSLYVSDPSHIGGELVVEKTGRSARLDLPADGTSLKAW